MLARPGDPLSVEGNQRLVRDGKLNAFSPWAEFKFLLCRADTAFDMNDAVLATPDNNRDEHSVSDGIILTAPEVACFLRVPKSTVYKLARQGELPASKIGKHWRFLREDVQGWMRRQSHRG